MTVDFMDYLMDIFSEQIEMIRPRNGAFEALYEKIWVKYGIEQFNLNGALDHNFLALRYDDAFDFYTLENTSSSKLCRNGKANFSDRFWKYNPETEEVQPCLLLTTKKLTKLNKIRTNHQNKLNLTHPGWK